MYKQIHTDININKDLTSHNTYIYLYSFVFELIIKSNSLLFCLSYESTQLPMYALLRIHEFTITDKNANTYMAHLQFIKRNS